ncbi:MAG: hypothetical protein MH137_04075 [Flavobacteriales bacterium]|nr:hypothetical protein [Flavobacteriales bacterium]
MSELFIDVIGWIGGAMVVLAYFLISSGKTTAKSVFFQFLNLAGSVFLIINTYAKEAYPSAVVNVIWVGIALYGFFRIWKK